MQKELLNETIKSLRKKVKNGMPPLGVINSCEKYFAKNNNEPNYNFFMLMGEVNSIRENFKNTVLYFTKALQQKKTAEVYFLLGKEYYKNGSIKQAILFINRALEQDKQNIEILSFLCEIYIDLDKYDDVFKLIHQYEQNEQSLNKDLSCENNSSNMIVKLTKLLLKKKKYYQALKLSKDALKKYKEDRLHHETMGISLLQLGKYKEALKFLEKSRSLNPLSSKYPIPTFTEKLKKIGNIPKKISAMETLVKKDSQVKDTYNYHFNIGFLYFYNGEHHKALNAFKQALDLKLAQI